MLRAGRGTLSEVMTVERALKDALVPLAAAALVREVDLVCEVLPNVGECVRGERRALVDIVTRAAAPALSAAAGRVVCVRVARQIAGFAPTDKVLVTVSIRYEEELVDVEAIEMKLPAVEGGEEDSGLAGMQILLVVPTLHLSRVHSATVRRFGAIVESVHDVQQARDRMREAARAGSPIDVLYLDDKTRHVAALLHETRDDASLGKPFGVVGTALDTGPTRDMYLSAGAALTLSKPVLPFELRDAMIEVRDASVVQASPASDGLPLQQRRSSGTRRLPLASMVAALAIGGAPRRR